MSNSKYKMTLSLNVLNHLGLNLYSNTPAVLAEVIANAWDADAIKVRVDFDMREKKITISDNGHGMDIDDINNKFLYVGYEKRGNSSNFRTLTGRKPMGRKGIGKLSLFSIANKIRVSSIKKGGEKESFSMDAEKIKRAIQNEDPSSPQKYAPTPEPFNVEIAEHGTVIEITELKKIRLTKATVNGLRKRIARRFGNFEDFTIYINDKKVTFTDRDYFHKARFLFQYGDNDYAKYCKKLDVDEDTGQKMCFPRPHSFNSDGQPNENGKHKISGWIAIARRSNDLDGSSDDDNLNKITIVVRGKVAQEDILQEYRLGGMITKYIYGEIHADFLDEDDQADIATSSRQKISEDDPRYVRSKRSLRKNSSTFGQQPTSLKRRKAWKSRCLPTLISRSGTRI